MICVCGFLQRDHEGGSGRVAAVSATGSEVNRCFAFRPFCTCGTFAFDGEPFAGFRPDCPVHGTARTNRVTAGHVDDAQEEQL